MPASHPRRPAGLSNRTRHFRARCIGTSVPGNRKPVAGMTAGRGMRAFLLAGVAIFRRGDEACFHRNACPDGRLDCASRFRPGPTHSLLLRRHLGRNLITVFSTVNTPREKKRRAAPVAARARRACRGARALSMDADVSHCGSGPRNETSFFKRFSPRALATDMVHATRASFRRWRGKRARGRMNGFFPTRIRSGGISRRTSPIARKCANPNRASAPSTMVEETRVRHRDAPTKRHSIRIAHTPRTRDSGPDANPRRHSARVTRTTKKPPAGTRTASGRPRSRGAWPRGGGQCSSSSSSSA